MNYDELIPICYDALHLVSLEHGWDLATADLLRTAMLTQAEPPIPETVSSLDIFNALAPSMMASGSERDECVASFQAVSLDYLSKYISESKV